MDIKKVMEERRSYYALEGKSPVSDEKIKEIVDYAVKHVPSAFNSQSTRTVLLLNEHHKKLWNIVEQVLAEIVPEEAFEATRSKIRNSFASGYGTILFYEDQSVVRSLQEAFPPYSSNFPVWSNQTSAMHQYAIWLLLKNEGLGASLQHYNPLIDQSVAKEWNIDPNWKLIAQMPFGTAVSEPGEKEFQPLESRSIMFK